MATTSYKFPSWAGTNPEKLMEHFNTWKSQGDPMAGITSLTKSQPANISQAYSALLGQLTGQTNPAQTNPAQIKTTVQKPNWWSPTGGAPTAGKIPVLGSANRTQQITPKQAGQYYGMISAGAKPTLTPGGRSISWTPATAAAFEKNTALAAQPGYDAGGSIINAGPVVPESVSGRNAPYFGFTPENYSLISNALAKQGATREAAASSANAFAQGDPEEVAFRAEMARRLNNLSPSQKANLGKFGWSGLNWNKTGRFANWDPLMSPAEWLSQYNSGNK